MDFINKVQDHLIDMLMELQEMKKLYKIDYIENPYYKFNSKEVEEFLKSKATRFTISGPRVWVEMGLNTNLSTAYDWIYNDNIEGIFEVKNNIYYFKKIDFPNTITKEFLIEDCKNHKLKE